MDGLTECHSLSVISEYSIPHRHELGFVKRTVLVGVKCFNQVGNPLGVESSALSQDSRHFIRAEDTVTIDVELIETR
jgi:hypothetical protein